MSLEDYKSCWLHGQTEMHIMSESDEKITNRDCYMDKQSGTKESETEGDVVIRKGKKKKNGWAHGRCQRKVKASGYEQ